MSFYEELIKFLGQAQEGKSLITNNFIKRYKDLKVKVSFGQGNPAKKL